LRRLAGATLLACADSKIIKARAVPIQIQAGKQVITAADPLTDDLRQALDVIICSSRGVH
jgi:hypothetical protein